MKSIIKDICLPPVWTPRRPGVWCAPAPEWSHTEGSDTTCKVPEKTAGAGSCTWKTDKTVLELNFFLKKVMCRWLKWKSSCYGDWHGKGTECTSVSIMTKILPRLGQGALQDESNVRNTLRANVAEKLADVWLAAHLCQKPARVSFTGGNKIKQSWRWFAVKAVTDLGSFPLLNANTVKSLNEVVQHLCLFARFNGEAVTGWVAGHPPTTCTKTTR